MYGPALTWGLPAGDAPGDKREVEEVTQTKDCKHKSLLIQRGLENANPIFSPMEGSLMTYILLERHTHTAQLCANTQTSIHTHIFVNAHMYRQTHTANMYDTEQT